MSPEEVISASGGTATRPDEAAEFSGNLIHLLTAPYVLADGQLQFQAQFVFHDFQQLYQVRLVPFVGDCNAVFRRLEETYGPGRESSFQVARLTKWFDRDNGNVIFLTEIQGSCEVDYRRFAVPNEAGGL